MSLAKSNELLSSYDTDMTVLNAFGYDAIYYSEFSDYWYVSLFSTM